MTITHRKFSLALCLDTSPLGRRAKSAKTRFDLAKETAALMDKIDHGYNCEETGKRVSLPRHARAYARSLALSGGIE